MGHGIFDMRIRRSLHGDKSNKISLCVYGGINLVVNEQN